MNTWSAEGAPKLRVNVVDPHEIDRTGLEAVLDRSRNRVTLTAAPPGSASEPDVILYGLCDQGGAGHDPALHTLLRAGSATVIVLAWRDDSAQARCALSCGAHAHLSKRLSGEELVAEVARIHGSRARTMGHPADDVRQCHPDIREAGLTSRELDVLTLVTRGVTNQQIADSLFLSINSVKTYIRTAYRKIGVSRRPQAVIWGLQHGLDCLDAHLLPTPAPLTHLTTCPALLSEADAGAAVPGFESRQLAG